MKWQLIAVGLIAAMFGMLTKGPVSGVASTEPVAEVSNLEGLLADTNNRIAELEQLVKYRPRWTFPGSIEGHMQAHGADVVAKSEDQLLAEHDAIHDVVGPVRAGEPIPQVQVAYQTPSDCPNGNCPVRDAVVNAAVATGAVVHAVLPPYPRLQQGYGSTGSYSTAVCSSDGYGSGGGYSSAVYATETYGSGGYSSQRYARGPVRGFLRRLCGR